jgi:hypothetical protein
MRITLLALFLILLSASVSATTLTFSTYDATTQTVRFEGDRSIEVATSLSKGILASNGHSYAVTVLNSYVPDSDINVDTDGDGVVDILVRKGERFTLTEPTAAGFNVGSFEIRSVLDESNNVIRATYALEGPERRSGTVDSSSYALLDKLPVGTYTIMISAYGYESVKEQITIAQGIQDGKGFTLRKSTATCTHNGRTYPVGTVFGDEAGQSCKCNADLTVSCTLKQEPVKTNVDTKNFLFVVSKAGESSDVITVIDAQQFLRQKGYVIQGETLLDEQVYRLGAVPDDKILVFIRGKDVLFIVGDATSTQLMGIATALQGFFSVKGFRAEAKFSSDADINIFKPADMKEEKREEPTACTMDVRQCPDGTAVGRVGPNCEFAPCPAPSEVPKPEEKPVCQGCMDGETCLPIGTRTQTHYCGPQGMAEQINDACNNNYECKTNLCIDATCVKPGVWKRFTSWFAKWF